MIDTIHVGLSGLRAFQKGLSHIGNNVANLNTPGFKRGTLTFTDLLTQQDAASSPKGQGVRVGSSITDFSQGEWQSSNNPLDVAIDGQGFFVLKHEEQIRYSRAGLFELDQNGMLISRVDRARVQALAGGRGLRDFSFATLRHQAARPTREIRLVDNLSSGAASHQVEVSVIDADGATRPLKIAFTRVDGATPPRWRVEVQDAATLAPRGSGEIQFQPNGAPEPGHHQVFLFLAAASGQRMGLTLDFGVPGTLTGATQLSAGTQSTLRVASHDGYGAGSLTSVRFDPAGRAQISYSNGQTAQADQLALAWFAEPSQALQRVGAGSYQAVAGAQARLGPANQSVFGKLIGQRLERSNVELSSEFSEMIITQRGYQAASQLISAANEIMQQALHMKGGR